MHMATSESFAEKVCELRNVAQFIAESLSKMILNGSLKPGERLVQTEIAEQFGVSRLPVRDAFKILENLELAVTLPRKGVVVRPIALKEIADLYEIRLVLECYACERAWSAITPRDIEELERIIQEQQEAGCSGDFIRLMEIDERFHSKLWSKCGNEEITRVLEAAWRKVRLSRAFAREIPDWNEKSVSGHKKIIEAVKQADYAAATNALRANILRARAETLRKLDSASE